MTEDEIHIICRKHRIEYYTIREDSDGFFIDVDGNVCLSWLVLQSIPIRFGMVTGNFDCSNNFLTSLEGCPTSVGGSFYCSDNILVSLEHCPSGVGGSFTCRSNYLTSLCDGPNEVGSFFECIGNKTLLSESYAHLFDSNIELSQILTDENIDLALIERQWKLNKLIND